MIVRRIEEVEKIDVGKPFGLPDNMMIIQWIFSNEVGDEKYHHKHAVRKYTLQPGLPLEKVPFHNHKYVQSPFILSGRMVFENAEGKKVELSQGPLPALKKIDPHLQHSFLAAALLAKPARATDDPL